MSFHYVSVGDSSVTIPTTFDAYATLGLVRGACSHEQSKAAFTQRISNPSRQIRAEVSLAYDAVGFDLSGKLGAEGCYYSMIGDVESSSSSATPQRKKATAASSTSMVTVTNTAHPFFLATVGACRALEQLISSGRIDKDAQNAWGASFLYIVSRSGFVDCVCMLYRCGVDLFQKQQFGSTALHAACYWSHAPVVAHLLAYGGSRMCAVKNSAGRTALQEVKDNKCKDAFAMVLESIATLTTTTAAPAAATSSSATPVTTDAAPPPPPPSAIAEVLKSAGSLVQKLQVARLPLAASRHRHRGGGGGGGASSKAKADNPFAASLEGEVVARRLPHPHFDEAGTRGWHRSWHGTKLQHLASILKHGLRPAGSHNPDGSAVGVRDGHIKRGVEVGGVTDWAAAIFVSPSISYAAHPAYAERVMFHEEGAFCCLLDVRVRPGTFSTCASTVPKEAKHTALKGEPKHPEMRVSMATTTASDRAAAAPADPSLAHGTVSELDAPGDTTVHRVGDSKNVEVAAIFFVKLSWIENTGMSVNEITALLDSCA